VIGVHASKKPLSKSLNIIEIDPYDIFAGISIHHAIQMIITLIAIILLSEL
jgi:hypothetical protein